MNTLERQVLCNGTPVLSKKRRYRGIIIYRKTIKIIFIEERGYFCYAYWKTVLKKFGLL